MTKTQEQNPITVEEAFKLLHNHTVFETDPHLYVEIDDFVMSMAHNMELYKKWLQRMIHGYYRKETGNPVRSDRKSRREFSRFMSKYNVTVEKDEDTSQGNYWTLLAGKDPENLIVRASLRIKELDGIHNTGDS